MATDARRRRTPAKKKRAPAKKKRAPAKKKRAPAKKKRAPARSRRRKPRIFVGSSSESLEVAQALGKHLSGVAEIVLWTNARHFRRPGRFFLDSLIEAASTQRFDFAIMVFGTDDYVLSRRERSPAPRDNVVFELGLFMSQVGRDRAFVVAPTTWKTKLRILSDLSGLQLAEYSPPTAKARRSRAVQLDRRLAPVTEELARLIKLQGLDTRRLGPRTVGEVTREAEDYLDSPLGARKRIIRNIALDMELTWPGIRDTVLGHPEIENVRYRVLFLNHRHRPTRNVASRTVSWRMAKQREEEIVEFRQQHLPELEDRRIEFECRVYSHVPIVHGFMFGDDTLFISFCGMSAGQLLGSPNPYRRFTRSSKRGGEPFTQHMFTVFDSWFDHTWKHARTRRLW